MAAVFSTRIIWSNTKDTWIVYQVPAGKRLVVRQVQVYLGGAAGDFAEVDLMAIPLVVVVPQGSIRIYGYDVRWTLYEGELVRLWLHGTGAAAAINGFLFDDPGGVIDPNNPSEDLESAPPAMALVGDDRR